MARKNRLIPIVFTYSVFGLLIGAALGFFADTLMTAGANARFQAHVMLYRMATPGSKLAARDFLAATLAKQGFLRGFADIHALDTRTQKLLAKELTVVARDPSSPNAELKLIGKDPVLLITTLDALAIYMTEALRSIDESDLQALMDNLNKEITPANENYLDLMSSRFEYEELPPPIAEKIRLAATLVEQKNIIELTQRYSFQPRSAEDRLTDNAQLAKLNETLQELTKQTEDLTDTNSKHFRFAHSLANADAKLRTLRQTKQRLVIEFNRGTPLRVTGRAIAERLEVQTPPTLVIVLISTVIGGLIGAIVGSIWHTRNSRLTGPSIEARLGVTVLGVIPRSLTDFGERESRPMAERAPRRVALAAIRSFKVALHFLLAEHRKDSPVIFTELGTARHAPHFIANLAAVSAQSGEHVLVIDTANNQLPEMFRDATGVAQASGLLIHKLQDNEKPHLQLDEGSIHFSSANTMTSPTALGVFSQFDHVLILASDADAVKHLLEEYGCGLGLVLCNNKTRLSKIRKAIGNALHGVVLCGHPIEESSYHAQFNSTA